MNNIKRSLRVKVAALLLVVALLLSTCAVYISFTTYKRIMEDQYRTMTENLAHTEAVALDNEALSVLTDKVMTIYREQAAAYGGSIPFNDFTDAEWDSYFSAYDAVYSMPEYTTTLEILRYINDANDVESIYVGYMDIETEMGVYIIDAAEENACLPGTCDVFTEGNAERVLAGNYDFPTYITNFPEYGWLASASAGVFREDGSYIASAFVDISMDKVVAERIGFLKQITLLLAVITLIASACAILLVDRGVVRPVKRLAKYTRSFVSDNYSGENNTDRDLSIRSNDEIGDLFASVEQMRGDIRAYIEDLTRVTAEKERISAELSIATRIQADMLPNTFPAFPERREFDIYATMTPAKEVGGDFYDFFMVDDRHVAIVMADVSGKGVPAALFMVIGKTLIKDHTYIGKPLEEVFYEVNNLLRASNKEFLFITAFEGVLDLVTGEFTYINAGHEMPFISRGGGHFEPYKIKPNIVLAIKKNRSFEGGTIMLNPGDRIFQYTDGVTEATAGDGGMYGMDRLEAILDRVSDRKANEVLPAVKADIDAFVGEAPQFDDITMLCLDYLERMDNAECADKA